MKADLFLHVMFITGENYTLIDVVKYSDLWGI